MLKDFDFLLLAHDIVEPAYFSDSILAWYFESIRDYYLDYQMRMDDVTLRNELKKASANNHVKSADVHAFLAVYKELQKPVDNKKYIVDEVATFCKHQAIKRAVLEVPPLLSKGSFDEIEVILSKALRTGMSVHDIGSQYFISWPERLANRIIRQEQKIIATGITELDKYLGGGVRARQLCLWMAPTSRGKSIALVHCGKRAVIMKKKVLHYTMELSEDEVAERYDASFSRIKVKDLVDEEAHLATSLEDLGKTFGNSLIIKYYPMHFPTIHTIRAHIEKCIGSCFIPDLILVDYLDLVKPLDLRLERREQLTQITLGLRNLGGEFDVPLVSATQSRRAAYSKEVHDEEDTSEDLGKAMHTDILITINQNKKEVKDGIIRLLLAKNRNGPRGVSVQIQTDLERMCFYDPTREFNKQGEPINTVPTMPKKPPPQKIVRRHPKVGVTT
jgi:replicative DNA helicase